MEVVNYLISYVLHGSLLACGVANTYYLGFQGGESFFRSVLASMEAVYLHRNPTAKAVLELVHSVDHNQICYDHLAFRTFGV